MHQESLESLPAGTTVTPSLSLDKSKHYAHHQTSELDTTAKNMFIDLLKAPMWYLLFVRTAYSTSFFEDNDDTSSSSPNKNNMYCIPMQQNLRKIGNNVLTIILPPALLLYSFSSAISDVIRYSFLKQTIQITTNKLPLVVGIIDASLSCLDFGVKIHGKWDYFKAKIVSRPLGVMAAGCTYIVGILMIVVCGFFVGCRKHDDHDNTEEHNDISPLLQDNDEAACSLSNINIISAMLFFLLGSFFLGIGRGLLWNVWTQVFKPQANKRLLLQQQQQQQQWHQSNNTPLPQHQQQYQQQQQEQTITSNPSSNKNKMDYQGKIAQIQVMNRYISSTISPLLAACLLNVTRSPIFSYLIICFMFILLCLVMARIVHQIMITVDCDIDNRSSTSLLPSTHSLSVSIGGATGKVDKSEGDDVNKVAQSILQENSSVPSTHIADKATIKSEKVSDDVIGWNEMLPACFSTVFSHKITIKDQHQNKEAEFLEPTGETMQLISPYITKGINHDDKSGRFSKAFFHCGMFSCLTESIRGGYTRIICLRAATNSNLSHTDLAHILSVVGGVATGFFWLSDIADTNRRLAAFISFTLLGLGHFGLSILGNSDSSSPMIGFYLSGIVFGLGEGVSSGLRALIKQDYLSVDGPIGPLTEEEKESVINPQPEAGCSEGQGIASFESKRGRFLRRQVCNKINIWADVTLVLNALIVGFVGHYCGMRFASFLYGVLSLYAIYFSLHIMPNTKPGAVSEETLWSSVLLWFGSQ